MITWIFIIIAAIGLFLALFVARKPVQFWPVLIVVSIGTSGLMIGGYTILDEFFVACVLLGGLASKHPPIRGATINLKKPSVIFFYILLVYSLFQALRGMIKLESLSKMRWILFFLVLIILTYLASNKYFPLPSALRTARLITGTCLAYFVVYIGYGVLGEALFGINRYDLQYAQTKLPLAIWGTTAYAAFPIAIALPAIFIQMRRENAAWKRLAWITFGIMVFMAFYYDSRVSILAITAFLTTSLYTLGFRRFLKIGLAVAIIFSFIYWNIWGGYRDLEFIKSDIFESGRSLWDVNARGDLAKDADRAVHIKIAFSTISDRAIHFLFGYGYRLSGYVIGPYFYDLYGRYRPEARPGADFDNFGTEAFSDYVINVGVVGLGLMLLSIAFVFTNMLRQKDRRNRVLTIFSLILLCGWTTVINMSDVLFFYISIMPFGLLAQLSQSYNRRFRMGDSCTVASYPAYKRTEVRNPGRPI